MKYFYKTIIFATCFLLILGCATIAKSEYSYILPNDITVKNEITINEDFDVIWDRLVKRLASSYFVINNIEKSSRIINLSFSSDTPELYVDCGNSHRTFCRNADEEDYNYNVASSSKYKMASQFGFNGNAQHIYYIDRQTHLNGRANIYIAPTEHGTIVSVNCRFVLEIKVNGLVTQENVFGGINASQSINSETSTIIANTNSPGYADWGNNGVQSKLKCISLGIIESEILNFAKP